MKHILTKTWPALLCAVGLGLCACSSLTREVSKTVPKPDGKPGESVQVLQAEIKPEIKQVVRGVGSLFGPVGNAVGECGLAIGALVLAEYNRRKLKNHIKETQ